LSVERVGVTGRKILPDGSAGGFVVDDNEAPRLTQPNRRGEAREFNKGLQRTARQWIATEAPDIPSPNEKIA
jgi:hypothetical protein